MHDHHHRQRVSTLILPPGDLSTAGSISTFTSGHKHDTESSSVLCQCCSATLRRTVPQVSTFDPMMIVDCTNIVNFARLITRNNSLTAASSAWSLSGTHHNHKSNQS